MLSHYQIIELNDIDSTNNYAMQLIDANKAQHGMAITTQTQSAGKGQRGKQWTDAPGQSLLMSIIILPKREISSQFVFNSSVAVAVVTALKALCPGCDIHIKWPNDIIINDKKAGGILIENVFRGSIWTHAVIGIGLNIRQTTFPGTLPFATSVKLATGKDIDILTLRDGIRENILSCVLDLPPETIMETYNQYLYKRNQKQAFTNGSNKWEATILNAVKDGSLEIQLHDGKIARYHHGQVQWDWG